MDGESEGIFDDNPEDCIFWFLNGAYFDPESPQCLFVTGDAYDLWNRSDIYSQILLPAKPLWEQSPEFVYSVGKTFHMFGGGTSLGPANVYTYRTQNAMLSSTQNYHRKSQMHGQCQQINHIKPVSIQPW